MKEVITSETRQELNKKVDEFMENHANDWDNITIVTEKNQGEPEDPDDYWWSATIVPKDTAEALKELLVEEHGYIDDFTTVRAIELELAAMEEEVTPEQLDSIVQYYKKDGIEVDRLENALIAVKEDEEWLESEEEDESDEFRHVINDLTPEQ